MSNSAVVRAVRRRINFYLHSHLFNKYGRSLRDFLAVTAMVIIFAFFGFMVFVIGFIDDGPWGIHTSCGTPDCLDQ